MKTAAIPQGKLSYLDRGTGDPLLFVHGFLVNGQLWRGVADALEGEFRCIVPEWPMGSHRLALEPHADLSPPAFADLIANFMDEIGLDRATLVGNDTGGAMSQVFTAKYPQRIERLILTNSDTLEHFTPFPFSLIPPIARVPGGTTALVQPFRIGPIARFTYGMLTTNPLDPGLVKSFLEPVLSDLDIRRDTRKLAAGIDKRHTLEAAERLRSFGRPIRFVWGVDDKFFKLEHARELAAMVPDAEIRTIANAATFSPLDQPQAVADAIASFARAGSPSAPATA